MRKKYSFRKGCLHIRLPQLLQRNVLLHALLYLCVVIPCIQMDLNLLLSGKSYLHLRALGRNLPLDSFPYCLPVNCAACLIFIYLFILLFHQHQLNKYKMVERFNLGHNVDRNRQQDKRA